ncbi:MFS transporter [Pseudoclavibacter sp. 13-3]|uniref:MFS transporter n=1 Tax=Pseudoclavibacter sp. 13-3 TaxID=2901228 RepID=UPI001E47D9E7|nr:MFS transporter [Pseudoclavibacter sp. 13-3]MCD7101065.1 MFS transporter [Pseudoclavibacter sp. 13-3]
MSQHNPSNASAASAAAAAMPDRHPRWQPKRPDWLAAAGVLFAVAWGGNEFTPLLAMYRIHEHMSAQSVNVLLGAYVLGIIPALLIGGPLSDLRGRRPLMHLAPALSIAGSLLLMFGGESHMLLFVGRIFSGLALGLVMAVGSSWIKELSMRPYSTTGDAGAGARRATMALTVGFALGAVVAALLAQFTPIPEIAPYAVNIVLTGLLWLLLLGTPETNASITGIPLGGDRNAATASAPAPRHESLRDALRLKEAVSPRFLLVVLPMAPWVFGAAASAYAVLPSLVMDQVPGFEVAFAGILCFVALTFGVLSQQLARKFIKPHSQRAIASAMCAVIVGVLIAALSAFTHSMVITIIAAAALGFAYGLLLIAGLQETQRNARPEHLGGMVGVYYSLTYLGFFIPAILSALAPMISYGAMFLGGAVIAAVSVVLIVVGTRKF